jgi:hypothetical protein
MRRGIRRWIAISVIRAHTRAIVAGDLCDSRECRGMVTADKEPSTSQDEGAQKENDSPILHQSEALPGIAREVVAAALRAADSIAAVSRIISARMKSSEARFDAAPPAGASMAPPKLARLTR